MLGPCVICGGIDYQPSMGGRTICPSCDCGNFGMPVIERQGKQIVELRAELDRLRAIVNEPPRIHDPMALYGATGEEIKAALKDVKRLRAVLAFDRSRWRRLQHLDAASRDLREEAIAAIDTALSAEQNTTE